MKSLLSFQSAAKKVIGINRLVNIASKRQQHSSVIAEEESVSSQVFDLNKLCADATRDNDRIWAEIREWLENHSQERVREAVLCQGDADMTALHYICRVNPPKDIVQIMCQHAEEALECHDSFGWIPMHYACACSADDNILELLSEVSPDCKTTVDSKGRTPLHFALHNKRPLTSELAAELGSTGAATYPDNQGKLPLHYACESCCNVDVVRALVDIHPDGVVTLDEKGRSPLLFCLANCDKHNGAHAVEFMLERTQNLVNRYKGDAVPLHALANRAHHIEADDKEARMHAAHCLELYMNAKPHPTADLISSIQQLPEWLQEEAVGLPIVQTLLNQKIIQPFPTAVLMLDFYVICMMVINFSTLVVASIRLRADENPDNDALGSRVIPLYVGIAYFFIRESTQFIGQASLGAFSTYIADATNLLDVIYISSVLYWAVLMQTGAGDDDIFQKGTALTIGLVWTNVMVYLKNMIIELAIFVAGVIYVVKRLGAFLWATAVILVAFAQVFMTLRQQTPYCLEDPNDLDLAKIRCGRDDDRPFCNFRLSIVRVTNMMLGGVDEQEFADTGVGLFFFVLFFFMGVVLLANVLIAIVTDSYGVVRDERAAIVFWFNRLDFVAEMDAIAHGPWNRKLGNFLGCGVSGDEDECLLQTANKSTFGSASWTKLLSIFEEEIDEVGWFSVLSWQLFLSRCVVAFIVLPIWLLLGLVSIGILWPPQVREYVLISAVSKKFDDGDGVEKDDQQRDQHVEMIEDRLEEMRDDLVDNLTTDRASLDQIRGNINDMRDDIVHEISEIRNYIAEVIAAHDRGDGDLPVMSPRRGRSKRLAAQDGMSFQTSRSSTSGRQRGRGIDKASAKTRTMVASNFHGSRFQLGRSISQTGRHGSNQSVRSRNSVAGQDESDNPQSNPNTHLRGETTRQVRSPGVLASEDAV